MDVIEAITKRKSIRDYKDTPVPEDKLKRVLEAGRMAPSGGNRQEMKFVVVREKETRLKLAEASGGQRHVGQAPVLIAAVATVTDRIAPCGVPAYPVDVAIAVDHMTLGAFEEGLGTCWIGAFRQEMVRKALKIPESCVVVSLLTMGYAAAEGRPKTRKAFDDVVCFDVFR
jgi:nitroreductase